MAQYSARLVQHLRQRHFNRLQQRQPTLEFVATQRSKEAILSNVNRLGIWHFYVNLVYQWEALLS